MASFSKDLGANEAPRGIPWPSSWASGSKDAFGTAFESYDSEGGYSARSATAPISHVWFTEAQGVASEIFWPTLDRKQIRDMQFLVSDGKEFFFEERTQAISRVSWVEKGVPAYRIQSSDSGGNFGIEKIFFTDPTRDTFLVKTRFKALRPGLHLYVLINPSVANTPYGDSAHVDASALTAWQDRDALALVTSRGFAQVSAGHSGTLDPFQDLLRDGKLDDLYSNATNGDVVMIGEIALPQIVGDYDFDMALGFGDTPNQARDTALSSLSNVDAAFGLYAKEWRSYESRISEPKNISARSSELFWSSVAVLKSLEDKTFPGAFVAAPTIPWGLNKIDNSSRASPRHTTMTRSEVPPDQKSQGIGGYHLVWPRDLYQMAESFISLGDIDSAKASLRYLEKIQFKDDDGYWDYGNRRFSKKGSFLQNSWLHGEAHWTMLQIDQSSYPILLAVELCKMGAVDFAEVRELVTTAADFVEANGPWTFQERWEENMGVAPATLAVQIEALHQAASLVAAHKDVLRAQRYLQRADQWQSQIENWTFTTSGNKGSGSYYARIIGTESPDAVWDPNSMARIRITNNGPALLEKSVVDGGFLELVRYGVRKAWDSFVRSTVEVYDSELKFDTDRGIGFKRYTADGYNWDEATGQQTAGMIWPFLSGERADYELSSLKEHSLKMSKEGLSTLYDAQVLSHLRAFEGFATPSGMFPEQVWDSGPRQGLPTGAATPLGWAHGEYVRLLRKLETFESRSLTPPVK
ncbi:MAG: glycoside hydrolase family 15 protein [Bdellovibrionota bacterium]